MNILKVLQIQFVTTMSFVVAKIFSHIHLFEHIVQLIIITSNIEKNIRSKPG